MSCMLVNTGIDAVGREYALLKIKTTPSTNVSENPPGVIARSVATKQSRKDCFAKSARNDTERRSSNINYIMWYFPCKVFFFFVVECYMFIFIPPPTQ